MFLGYSSLPETPPAFVYSKIQMENIIYGLEFNARSLTTQQDAEEIRFFIGTQIINGTKNQIHMVEVDEENNKLHAKIFSHDFGEIWKLTSCPNDKLIASVYTTNKRSPELLMQSAIFRIPDTTDAVDPLEFADIEILDTEIHGSEIKTTEFHPSNTSLVASIVDGKVLLFNRTESKSQVVAEISGKKLNGGMWSNAHQFVALYENGLRSYDIRDPNHVAWQIDEAHSQAVRDLDVNPNKAFHIASCGDDGALKIFDVRNSKEPVFSRRDHSHWIFSVSFNKFHDQLILTSSSDGTVLLTCASSCSSEAPKDIKSANNDLEDDDDDDEFQHKTRKTQLKDGLLESFEQHEDSVYCVEWSAADPWIFASVSYDGRVIVSRIPKKYKYQILL